MNVQNISIDAYDYPLPDDRIARYPLPLRSSSKLLTYRAGEIEEHHFSQLPELLPEGCLLVRNNSRVIRARIHIRKATGAEIEIFCLDPSEPSAYEAALGARGTVVWHCLIGNAKRWRGGLLEKSLEMPDGTMLQVQAERVGEAEVRFSWPEGGYTFGELLEAMGQLPIPPYLGRETEEGDLETYQTVYARHEGSVAAPTAGLHFTPEVFAALGRVGTRVLDVTLHVGAGTFRPVKAEQIGEHEMHSEWISLEREVLEELSRAHGGIVAIGTTSVRTLESLYHLALKIKHSPESPEPEGLHVEQWSPYRPEAEELSREEALGILLGYMDLWGLERLCLSTSIMIAPGYRFRMIRGLITNFHQPRSTLLLLISALVGDDWHRIYDYALRHDFRFLSYGDSSLLLP